MAAIRNRAINYSKLTELITQANLDLDVAQNLFEKMGGVAEANRFAGVLDVLCNGYDAINNSWQVNTDCPKYQVSKDDTVKYVTDTLAYSTYAYTDQKTNQNVEGQYLTELQKTPGWKQMHGEGGSIPAHQGKQGFLGFQLPLLPNSPVTGPQKTVPPLCEQMLNGIHPKFTQNLEKFCNLIRTRAYLAIPAMAFGSLQRIVAGVNGLIGAFQKVIHAVYQGVIRLIQQAYAVINGIINEIKKWIIFIIEQLVPLDLICLILETIQVVMDDIAFFTSLFSQSGSIFQYLNQFQQYINIASNIASNPLSFLESFLPPEVKEIMDLVNQVGTDPGGFLCDQLTNYGYSWAAEALQGNIVAALVDKFGPQFRAIGPLSTLINESGLSLTPAYYPATPATMQGSSEFPVVDSNLNPIDGFVKIIDKTGENLSDAVGDVGKAFTDIGDAVKSIGQIPKDIKKAGSALKDYFN